MYCVMIVHHASPSLIAAIACCACGGRPSVRLARTLSSQRIRLSSNLANVAAGGSAYHVPVLRDECVDWLITDASGVYVDATLGGGGHSEEILARLAPHNGRLFSCDRDSDAIKTARRRLAPYVESGTSTLLHTSFANLRRVLPEVPVDGILLDLGVSSHQIDEGSRGFSFRTDGPLDMRMDQASAIYIYIYIYIYIFTQAMPHSAILFPCLSARTYVGPDPSHTPRFVSPTSRQGLAHSILSYFCVFIFCVATCPIVSHFVSHVCPHLSHCVPRSVTRPRFSLSHFGRERAPRCWVRPRVGCVPRRYSTSGVRRRSPPSSITMGTSR